LPAAKVNQSCFVPRDTEREDNMDKLVAMINAELAADEWWDKMTDDEKKSYVAAHPGSKYGDGSGGKVGFAEHLSNLPHHAQEKFNKLSENSKKALQDWHEKSPVEKAKHVGNGLVNFAKTAAHHTKHVAQHEMDMYKHAGQGIGKLATGHKWGDLEPHHKKAIKGALLHAGLTAASMAAGDVTGHGAHAAHVGVSDLLSAFAQHHAEHSAMIGAGESAVKTGGHYLKKAVAAEKLPPNVEAEAKKMAALLVKADIPMHVFIEVLEQLEKKLQQSEPKK
jgi:hypothetical protein